MRHTGGHLKDKEWKAGRHAFSTTQQRNQNKANRSQTNRYKRQDPSGEKKKSVIKTFSSTELLSGRESGEEGIHVRWGFPETIEHTHELSH